MHTNPSVGVDYNRLTFKPAEAEQWPDLETLFDQRGVQNGCWCMYWRMTRNEFSRGYGERNKQALRQIVESGRIPGILAYLDGKPVGWCSIAPREEFGTLDRSPTLKRIDDRKVWSIVCFFIDKSLRNQGLSERLIQAAVAHARGRGATIIEAYPLIPENTREVESQRYTGIISSFLKAGFVEVARRSPARAILRLDLSTKQVL